LAWEMNLKNPVPVIPTAESCVEGLNPFQPVDGTSCWAVTSASVIVALFLAQGARRVADRTRSCNWKAWYNVPVI
jgi:hypothetical protein